MLNAAMLVAWGLALGNVPQAREGPELLIVAPRGLTPVLAEYVRFKEKRLATEVISLEEALARGDECAGGWLGPAADDAERLKRCLFERWRASAAGGEAALRYVLLVGDADVMPVRYMALDRNTKEAFDYAFYPSDLYYGDLARRDGSFEDWNGRKDGFHAKYFGEVRGEHFKSDPINFDGVDYRPEVAVGRWPVSTPEDVAMVAGKTMAYEESVEAGRIAARAGMVMVGGWVDARGMMDGWVQSLPSGWSVERRYYRDGRNEEGGEAQTPPPTEQEVVGLLNEDAEGGIGLVVHAGHGSDDTWHASLGVRGLGKIANAGRAPVMLSAGCSTARFATLPPYEPYEDARGNEHAGTNGGEVFDAPPPAPSCYARGKYNLTGLGERLLRDGPTGATAYIGCSTGSQPCGLTLAEGFVLGLAATADANGATRLGDCWVFAIGHYYESQRLAAIEPTESWYPASIFFQGMKFMVFGDPSIPMPVPRN